MPEVRVLFLGIGKPVPPFIRNRILQLDKTGGVRAVVLVPDEILKEFHLENGLTLPELPIRFSPRHTLLPLLWFSFVHPVSTFRLWLSLSNYAFRTRCRTFLKYHSLVRVSKTEVIHFQWIVSSDEINWARKFFKVPVIISARGIQLTVYPATEPGYENKIRESLSAADYIHAVSQSMANACARFGAEPAKIFVNYNGIDIERLNSTNNKVSSGDGLQLISTGTLMWRKGYLWQLLLIKALKETQLRAKLKIIGDGPDRQGLQYTIIRLGLQDAVTMEGQKSPEEVIRSLQSSDIYISTSTAEGLSNAVLEAIASALPVVAFDCEGMKEVIENGYNGFIVPFGDIESIREKIAQLNNDRKLMHSMGQNGSALASGRFDYKVHIKKIVDFYHSISPGDE